MAWLAWIPIANLYLITQIAEVPWWAIFGMLLGFIPIAGTLIILGLTAFWYWKISEKRDKPGWLGILMIIPIANLVAIGILAWSD